jgi:hypothetical protein
MQWRRRVSSRRAEAFLPLLSTSASSMGRGQPSTHRQVRERRGQQALLRSQMTLARFLLYGPCPTNGLANTWRHLVRGRCHGQCVVSTRHGRHDGRVTSGLPPWRPNRSAESSDDLEQMRHFAPHKIGHVVRPSQHARRRSTVWSRKRPGQAKRRDIGGGSSANFVSVHRPPRYAHTRWPSTPSWTSAPFVRPLV